MAARGVYLAKYRPSPSTRAHFAIFVPNAPHNRDDVGQTFLSQSTKGTIIHVVGEPMMAGFSLEFKRNYECWGSLDLEELVALGQVDPANSFEPGVTEFIRETIPRSKMEVEATKVRPPPRGQNIRAPIDGVRVLLRKMTRRLA